MVHGQTHAPPRSTFVESLVGMFDAGQAVILDRIDLLRLQMSGDIARLLSALALVLAGVAVALVGWSVVVAALAGLLSRVLDWEFALLIVGGIHVVAGALATFLGIRATKMAQSRPAATRELVFHE